MRPKPEVVEGEARLRSAPRNFGARRRKGWDSNPQRPCGLPVFKTGGITNYPTLPLRIYILQQKVPLSKIIKASRKRMLLLIRLIPNTIGTMASAS